MNTHSTSANGPLLAHIHPMRWLIAALLLFSLLLNFNVGVAQASHKPEPPPAWSAYPVAAGTVTDVNFDGKGDWIAGGFGSVMVGFNCLGQTSNVGPGEQRGVYEFDLHSAPKMKGKEKAVIVLNSVGTRINEYGTDNHLTLYAGKGNGAVDLADFSARRLAVAFDVFNVDPSLSPYEYQFDVTKIVRRLVDRHDRYIAFVLRPNPAFKTDTGCFLFSGTGYTDPGDQFLPAKMVISK